MTTRRRRSSVPPRPVRRLLLGPIVPVVATVGIVVLPIGAAVGVFATRFLPGPLKPVRLLWVMLVGLARESVGITALFGLWLASGFGWRIRTPVFQRQHVRLIGWYLWGLVGTAQRTLGMRIVIEEAPGALSVEPHVESRPLLVLSRHAGVGDSLLLAHQLVNIYGRTPSIILKDTLQWAPCLDVVLNRLPNRFIASNPRPGAGAVESIASLAAELPSDGALILFPEGGNFSEARRLRAIERLVEQDLPAQAAKARALMTVLPPRPRGTLAAIDAAPHADVVFVAHTGLERLSSMREVIAGVPMEHSVRMSWWLVRARDIPHGDDARIAWLYDWWERIDTWIQAHAEPGLEPVTRVDAEQRRATRPSADAAGPYLSDIEPDSPKRPLRPRENRRP